MISENGILYVEVAGPEGPKVYAIDVISGKILKNKPIDLGYTLLGTSKNAVYLGLFEKDKNKNLIALDRAKLDTLWHKDLKELGMPRIWITEKGIFYSTSPIRETEIGFIDDITGQVLWRKKVKRGFTVTKKVLFLKESDQIREGMRITGWWIVTTTSLDLSTGKFLGVEKRKIGTGGFPPLDLYLLGIDFLGRLSEDKEGIVALDINTGQLKWKSEKMKIGLPLRLAGATEKVVILHSSVSHKDEKYTLWYGVDATNGKILWEKWAQCRKDELCLYGDTWTGMADEILLVLKGSIGGDLILVDTITGRIIGEQKKIPIVGRHHQATYKDILIVGMANGLKAYQIKIQ